MHLAILGGGPVGLEMALAATHSGWRATLLEQGDTLASNVLKWGHVELFSPNSLNMSALGRQTLKKMSVPLPEEEKFPTGREYYESYLEPLGRYLEQEEECDIQLRCKVVSVARAGMLKGDMSQSRREQKFNIFCERTSSSGEIVETMMQGFDVIVDATGTYGNFNYSGPGGLPALGERTLERSGDIVFTIPDIQHPDTVPRYSGSPGQGPRHTLVLGCGASAVTCLSALRRVGVARGGVAVTWVTRRGRAEAPYNIVQNDPLPQRESLYKLGNQLSVENEQDGFERFQYKDQTQVTSYTKTGETIRVTMENITNGKCETIEVDSVLACVGYRPDKSITQELQIHYCYASDGPMKLAASLLAAGGGGGDCLKQQASGDETLMTPESNVFILGMKSYGRGSAFLLRLGHQQVESVIRIVRTLESENE